MTGTPNPAQFRRLAPGIPDAYFLQPSGRHPWLIGFDLRMILLGHLLGDFSPGDTIWDLCPGVGAVAIETAILRPDITIHAHEPEPKAAELLHSNNERFGVRNVQVRTGSLLETLRNEPQAPRAVLLNDRCQPLGELLNLLAERVALNGWLVAPFAVLDNLGVTLQFLRHRHWKHEVVEVQIARTDPGYHGLRPQRAVYVVQGEW